LTEGPPQNDTGRFRSIDSANIVSSAESNTDETHPMAELFSPKLGDVHLSRDIEMPLEDGHMTEEVTITLKRRGTH